MCAAVAAPVYAASEPISVVVQTKAGKAISPDLFGIFFEDINYAADGGLYAELIQNRSFEYNAIDRKEWSALTSWELVTRGQGKGGLDVDNADPIHPNNRQYAVFSVAKLGDGVGLANSGFGGIAVRAGESYDVSLFAKQLFVGERWGAAHVENPAPKSLPLVARLETANGDVLCEAELGAPDVRWTRLSATLTPKATEAAARFVLMAKATGGVAVDVVSLFPKNTFHQRPNGLRADLAQVIADLEPKFIRFPGGCLAHGNGLGNMYRWKDTVGPVEQRREQPNLWRYHQTVGLGYFEYFQYCEDIGAKALPVLAAGVCCQNSGHTNGVGQRGLPLEEMPAYIQEVLDLIEYANGPATSRWGAVRAAAGHPASFNLEYVGVGNEDAITEEFRQRFKMIHDAVKAKHPEIKVVGTVGPFPDGTDYDEGWKFATTEHVAIVDEHYYKSPQWFWENLKRYDSYDRSKSKVYVGEYAAHDTGRRSTLRSALAEAAGMTTFERNGDVVVMSSYAPLLAKIGNTQWTPDLIYFTNTAIFPTVNYYAQKLMSANAGDTYLPTTIAPSAPATAGAADLAISTVRNSKSGDVILKIVNGSAEPRRLKIALDGLANVERQASCSVLAGNADAVNDVEHPNTVVPQTTTVSVGQNFEHEVPASSLTVLRLKTGRK
jgi:alpha-L-arabinofuranosidase